MEGTSKVTDECCLRSVSRPLPNSEDCKSHTGARNCNVQKEGVIGERVVMAHLLTVKKSSGVFKSTINWRLCRVLLFTLAFGVLMSSATAQECIIDLAQIPSTQTAQCEESCQSCTFFLENFVFKDGTVLCTRNVPCFVEVKSQMMESMSGTTVDGSAASNLSVLTSEGTYPWTDSVILAPFKGDFLFESYNSLPLMQTTIKAIESRVVEIIIRKDVNSFPDPYELPELASVDIFASTADHLYIDIAEGSRFAYDSYSNIHCPTHGTFVWKSDGERYDRITEDMSLVKLLIPYNSTTVPHLICADNYKSCDGVKVFCNDKDDSCNMVYEKNSDWVCVTQKNEGCEVNSVLTTTPEPTLPPPNTTWLNTSTEVPITTTPNTTSTVELSTSLEPTTTKGKEDKDDSGFDSNMFLIILGVGFGALCVGFSANFVWVRREELRHPRTYVMQKYNDLKDSFKGEVSEMDRNQQLYLAQLGARTHSR